jgi:putative two-component system response regulator
MRNGMAAAIPAAWLARPFPRRGASWRMADVFDALTSERPYKKAWPVERAVALLQEGAGSHFDPKLVPPFLEILPRVLEIKDHYAEETASNETVATVTSAQS